MNAQLSWQLGFTGALSSVEQDLGLKKRILIITRSCKKRLQISPCFKITQYLKAQCFVFVWLVSLVFRVIKGECVLFLYCVISHGFILSDRFHEFVIWRQFSHYHCTTHSCFIECIMNPGISVFISANYITCIT